MSRQTPTTKAEHTPGPWIVRHGATDSVIHASSVNGNIACVYGYVVHGSGTKSMSKAGQREANAALIAAAPDLLAALQRIADSDGFNGGTWVGELQRIARAAIANAEERQP